MKDIELKLISELMKNSQRSDRELAKILGVSQPTISRTKQRLEKEGVIKEYTMIPDFTKLGFEIMSMTFAKLKEPVSDQRLSEITNQLRQTVMKEPLSRAIIALPGIGTHSDRVIVAFHEDYSSYTKVVEQIRKHPLVAFDPTRSFLVDLKYGSHYLPLPLTFHNLANYIGNMKSKTTKKT